ncbi:hypothetical protein [Paenibacillus wynnii]|uniref:Uncharacterized protein n=1 Tax=Paenibacillus wynnii TaxID=268407 RepID=A0A098M543_9BACL|nr:hypothetical protein [Paenibacillus wynnii]KGE17679.1 hypothetical protein PWYN_24215 [Paenibacillus wynnii]
MKIRRKPLYRTALIILLLIIITGCNAVQDKSIILNTYTDQKEKGIPASSSFIADTNLNLIMNGEGSSGLYYSGDAPLQISIKNIGSTEFDFRIRNKEREAVIQQGTLKPRESFEYTYEESSTLFPEGDYILVFSQSSGAEMSAHVETELKE